MHMADMVYSEVNIDEISDDDFFKVSRRNINETLLYSLKNSGMLETPHIIKTGGLYSIFTCHNRIKILRESGVKSVKCLLLDVCDAEIFIKHIILKAFRNEIGPVGKLKAVRLLDRHFNLAADRVMELCVKVFKIPADAAGNELFYDRVLSFPDDLKWYLDDRDLNFRVIKDLSMMADEWTAVMSGWLSEVPVRVNIFRQITDSLFDMYRRGDSIRDLEEIQFTDDRSLYSAIFNLRYPDYSVLKAKSDSIIGKLNIPGVYIDFPELLDRGYITVRLDINKKGGASEQLKKITRIDAVKLDELLSLL